jgi:hypothetical protein
MRGPFKLLRTLRRIRRKYPSWFNPSDREHAEPDPWPEGFGAKTSPVYSRNQITIHRPPDQVFLKLMLAEQWPRWYENSDDVRIHPPPGGRFVREDREGVPARERVLVRGEGEREVRERSAPVDSGSAIPGTGTPQLGPGVKFTWTTFGIRVDSEVTEYRQDRLIAWTARAFGVDVYHRWFFRPTGSGTLVVTEECENGLIPSLLRRPLNRGLHAGHRLWLESLEKV